MTDVLDRSMTAMSQRSSGLRWDDVVSRAEGTPPTSAGRRRGARRQWFSGAALVGVAAAVAVLAMIWSGSDGQQIRTAAGPTSTGPATSETPASTGLPGVSTTTAVSPSIGWRSFATTGVSETTYVVWGGESGSEMDRLDGFAVDLASGDVTEIPDAPMVCEITEFRGLRSLKVAVSGAVCSS